MIPVIPLLADIGTIFALVFLVISFISWVGNLGAEKQGPGNRRIPQNRNARRGRQDEIEEFMNEIASRKKGERQPPSEKRIPTARERRSASRQSSRQRQPSSRMSRQSSRQSSQESIRQRLEQQQREQRRLEEQQRRKVAQQREQAQAEERRRQLAAEQAREKSRTLIDSSPASGGLRNEHLVDNISHQVIDQFGHHVSPNTADSSSDKFSQDSTSESDFVPARGVPYQQVDDLVQLIRDPNTVAQAILLNEILGPPKGMQK